MLSHIAGVPHITAIPLIAALPQIAALSRLALVLLVIGSGPAGAVTRNGFDLDGADVPVREIRRGGPPRDGIPAIVRPKFLIGNSDGFLKPDDRVLGIVVDGAARAYPVRILVWHEVVNDWTGRTRLIMTYCPLCGSGMAFSNGVDGRGQDAFGVSGLLYQSDVLLYDTSTESLWSQILGRAVTGPRRGERLPPIPVVHTTWDAWRKRHPDSFVLSRDTGYKWMRYERGPEGYAGYERSRQLMFPVSQRDRRYHPKEWVLGVEVADAAGTPHFKAYPFSELGTEPRIVEDDVAGTPLRIHVSAQDAWISDVDNQPVNAIRLFWFAWFAFHPDTLVYAEAEAEAEAGADARRR